MILVSSPLEDLCLDIWISVMMNQETKRDNVAMYYYNTIVLVPLHCRVLSYDIWSCIG